MCVFFRHAGSQSGLSFPIRLFVTNESGYYLDISVYREVTNSQTGQVLLCVYTSIVAVLSCCRHNLM